MDLLGRIRKSDVLEAKRIVGIKYLLSGNPAVQAPQQPLMSDQMYYVNFGVLICPHLSNAVVF